MFVIHGRSRIFTLRYICPEYIYPVDISLEDIFAEMFVQRTFARRYIYSEDIFLEAFCPEDISPLVH
jgi:hypothetical protein